MSLLIVTLRAGAGDTGTLVSHTMEFYLNFPIFSLQKWTEDILFGCDGRFYFDDIHCIVIWWQNLNIVTA